MFSSVFLKTLYDKRWFFIGWSVGSVALLALTAAFFPTFADAGIDQLFKAIPPALKGIVGDVQDYGTYPGYLATAVFGIRAQMLFVPLAIILGIGLGLRDESSGKLYQMLALPVSRVRMTLERWLAGLVIIAAVMAVVFVSLIVTSLAIDVEVPYTLLAQIGVMSTLFSTALFSATYGLGVAFGQRSIALLIPVLWVMGSLIIDAFKFQIDWLDSLEKTSILFYYQTSSLVRDGLSLGDGTTLAVISICFVVLALVLFPRRDIREGSE